MAASDLKGVTTHHGRFTTSQSSLFKKAPASRQDVSKPNAGSKKMSGDPRKKSQRLAKPQSPQPLQPVKKTAPSRPKTATPLASTVAAINITPPTAPPEQDTKALPDRGAPQTQPKSMDPDDASSLSSENMSSSSASVQSTLNIEIVRVIFGNDIAYIEALQRAVEALNLSPTRNDPGEGRATPILPTSPDMADSSTISQILQLLCDTARSSEGSSITVGTPGGKEPVTSQKQAYASPSREQKEKQVQPEDSIADQKPMPKEKVQEQQPHDQQNI